MSAGLSVGPTTRLFRDGVTAVERVAAGTSSQAWQRPACGHWTGVQTARHLLAVARWYHEWLDRAIAGNASSPFPATEMDRRNERALTAVGDMPATEAIALFVESANRYVDRVVDHWDLAYGYPFGTVTAGLHCGVAATEWHLHAWDLSRNTPDRHRPSNPEGLFLAAAMCVAEARGGWSGALLRPLLPLGARIKPWETLLRRSGRDPGAD